MIDGICKRAKLLGVSIVLYPTMIQKPDENIIKYLGEFKPRKLRVGVLQKWYERHGFVRVPGGEYVFEHGWRKWLSRKLS